MRQEAFSLEFGRQCAQELAITLARQKMDERARKREIREFAEVVKRVYQKQKRPDWVPVEG